MAGQGRDKFVRTVRELLDSKQDSRILISALLGRYNELGEKQVTVGGRTNFVYVRVRGRVEEVWQVYNDTVGLEFGTPVLIEPDPTNIRQYRVYGRDSSKLQNWTDPATIVPPHGNTHSFATATPKDPVWIYRRQLVQPLLCRPQKSPDMTVYVEADFYFWGNQFKYFYGGSSPDMTGYKPVSINDARYVTVYLNGSTGLLGVVVGDIFSKVFPPADKVPYIPEIDPSIGFPLACVYLTSSTSTIRWADVYDLRILIYSPSSGTSPGVHNLDPIYGTHTGMLPAIDVSVADPSGVFSSTNVEDALYEIYNGTIKGSDKAYDLTYWDTPTHITGSHRLYYDPTNYNVVQSSSSAGNTLGKGLSTLPGLSVNSDTLNTPASLMSVFAQDTNPDSIGASIGLYRARGTLSSPTGVQTNDDIGDVFWAGLYDPVGSWYKALKIRGVATEIWNPAALGPHGAKLTFMTTANASGAIRAVVDIDQDGHIYNVDGGIHQKYPYLPVVATGNFLRDDGTWQPASGGTADPARGWMGI